MASYSVIRKRPSLFFLCSLPHMAGWNQVESGLGAVSNFAGAGGVLHWIFAFQSYAIFKQQWAVFEYQEVRHTLCRSDTSGSDNMGCVILQVVAYWFACVQTPGIFFCIFLIDLYFSTIVHQHFLSLWQIEKKGTVSPDMAFHFEYFLQIPSNFVLF